ncbi:MAG: Methyltransferase type 11 [Candidatus Amesbacteria bacterium GW2011_GWA2_47_11b]|uniref:Methyltransferase type 11 n=3 Tax=Candidatus Amesiibacteriota TaxID=1752730 RepID=A0A0G1RMZ9_9BACT|nr:MAG: Methyltransferase type 11 [Microgenomates group bacterium GW2011_GWC1_46_20]KKU58521.1 MAG: Methyltransferase type 11 [Candidatus Amesbacteria bacterium GW2011_GWA2_47_11b]KKU83648.1 MAG: Methyltransferase type 11 [Candidatus Amesbacteria bacterium GW2011_GWC2_47_8]HCH59299.1 hypothetical protein [Candidatus Zambryskibacteria bacterium]
MGTYMQLKDIVKPRLRFRLNTNGVPNFLNRFDINQQYQVNIWNEKTYQVNPKTHVFTTIQEHFGNRLIRNLKIPHQAVVIDLGCFIGEKLWQLKNNLNYLGVGVDIAISSLKIARKIDIYGHHFLAADMENLPFKNSCVDLVMVFDVIEHLSHAEKGFAEIARVLKPDGKLLLHIPIKDNKWSMFWWKQKLFPQAAFKDYADVGHSPDRMLTRRQIKIYLEKYNLRIEKEIPYNVFLVHFWDREIVRVSAWLFSLLFRSGRTKSNVTRTLQTGYIGRTREFYGRYLVPLLELFSFPDWIFSYMGVGNTYFVVAAKRT